METYGWAFIPESDTVVTEQTISLLENTLALDTLASVNYQPNLLNKIITSLNE